MRRCMGCMASFPKSALVRILRTSEGKIILDTTGKADGRGAYMCRNTDCLAKARKARRMERSFKGQVPAEVYAELEELLS
ncbi:MAG: YlxR family protein [Oscillospiraceae bacterium]|nr:YlxR family protein [Oscillospiraceae bacterium]